MSQAPNMSETDTRRRLITLMNGYRPALAVYAAASLGIADVLADEGCTADEVAKRTGTHAPSMARLLRMLHALGLLALDEGRYSLTAVGTHLRRDAPASLRDAVLYSVGHEIDAYRVLADGVRDGRTPFEIKYGRNTFAYLSLPENAELARLFDGFMSGLTTAQAKALIPAYDFSRHHLLMDVGGGDGSLLAAILRAHPSVRGRLFDLPHVAEAARRKLAEAGVAERCEIVGGSFFDDLPSGADAVMLKFILHDWDDAEATRILQACRRAMTRDARLLVIDRIIPDRDDDPDGYAENVAADIHMFVNTGGRERTRGELEALLKSAGFELERVVSTGVPPVITVARPI